MWAEVSLSHCFRFFGSKLERWSYLHGKSMCQPLLPILCLASGYYMLSTASLNFAISRHCDHHLIADIERPSHLPMA